MSLVDSAIVRLLPVVPKPVVRRISGGTSPARRWTTLCAWCASSTPTASSRRSTSSAKRSSIPTRPVRSPAPTARRSTRSSAGGSTPTSASSRPALGLKLGYELCRENLEALVRRAAELAHLRADRHGGLVHDRRDARALPRAAGGRARERRDRPAGAASSGPLDDVRALAELRPNVRLCKGIYVERPEIAFQRLRRGAGELRAVARRAARGGLLRGDRDPRRVAARAREAARRRARARSRASTSSRCCSAFDRLSATSWSRGPPAAHLHAVRRAVVRVLAAPAAGEPASSPATSRPTRSTACCRAATARRDLDAGRGLPRRDEDGRELISTSRPASASPRSATATRGSRRPGPQQTVVHALGDLADAAVTAALRERLPYPAKLGVTGEDAVEIGLRTALLTTGSRDRRLRGAYHGTGLLALAATSIEPFRAPFAAWLPGPVYRFAYGEDPGPLPADAGCVIVEPVQARGGARVPPDDFLRQLRRALRRGGRGARSATRSTAASAGPA